MGGRPQTGPDGQASCEGPHPMARVTPHCTTCDGQCDAWVTQAVTTDGRHSTVLVWQTICVDGQIVTTDGRHVTGVVGQAI